MTNITPRRTRLKLEPLEAREVPATLYVDDDRRQRTDAEFTTIAAAIAAAGPGDRIVVAPGAYEGGVFVDKPLSLFGARAGDKPGGRGDDAPDPDDDTIVFPADGGVSAFTVAADGVRIDGFTIRGATDAPGILLSSGFSGHKIVNNIIRENAYGIDVSTRGVLRTRIERNYFLNNNARGDNDLDLVRGYGVFSNGSALDVRVVDNTFVGHDTAAVAVTSPPREEGLPPAPSVRVAVKENLIVDNPGHGLYLRNVVDSVVEDNRVVRPGGHGIFLAGSVRGVRIAGNDLRDGAGAGISMAAGGEDGYGNNRFNDVKFNRIRRFASFGVHLQVGSMGNRIEANVVTGSGVDGINLDELADFNRVYRNTVTGSGRDGIRADVFASLNTIKGNRLRGNGEHDAHDDSTGERTAGTANTWLDNDGDSENRPGLLD